MYNGIGLPTPRGSGTNGYVQRNVVAVPKSKYPVSDFRANPKHELDQKPNEEILLHQRKREVELKCFTLQVELEEQGIEEDAITSRVTQLRQDLLRELHRIPFKSAKDLKDYEIHERNEAKRRELQNFREALGISSEHVEGAAFDRDLQEQLKNKRREEYELKNGITKKKKRKKKQKDSSSDSSSSESSSSSSSKSSRPQEKNNDRAKSPEQRRSLEAEHREVRKSPVRHEERVSRGEDSRRRPEPRRSISPRRRRSPDPPSPRRSRRSPEPPSPRRSRRSPDPPSPRRSRRSPEPPRRLRRVSRSASSSRSPHKGRSPRRARSPHRTRSPPRYDSYRGRSPQRHYSPRRHYHR